MLITRELVRGGMSVVVDKDESDDEESVVSVSATLPGRLVVATKMGDCLK